MIVHLDVKIKYKCKKCNGTGEILKDKEFSTNQNRFFTYMASIGKKISNPERINLFYIANRIELNLESKLELISLTSNEAINKFLLHEIQMMEKIQEQESWLQQKFHLN